MLAHFLFIAVGEIKHSTFDWVLSMLTEPFCNSSVNFTRNKEKRNVYPPRAEVPLTTEFKWRVIPKIDIRISNKIFWW